MALTRFFRNYFFLNTGSPGVRFRTGDKPTQMTFSELFCSTGFIKEKDDTATLTAQGFLKIAQDAASQARNSTLDVDGFTKAVMPHQLPNVYQSTVNSGVLVTSVNQALNRTGGTGKDFYIRNNMLVSAATTIGNPIIVTQVNRGSDATIDFDFSVLAAQPGQVLVNISDTQPDYLTAKISTNTTCRVAISSDIANAHTMIDVTDKIREVTMYHGTNAEYATDFAAGVGIVGTCWEGWVVCDGNTYQNSQLQNVVTPNMIGRAPFGFDTGTLAPTMGTVEANSIDTPTLPVTLFEDVVILFVKYIG